jgi:hypothetical protein
MKSLCATSNKGEKPRSIAKASVASGDVLIAHDEGGLGVDLMPLRFLLRVLNDAKAPAAIKVKVASATLPYTHPKQSKSAQPTVVVDRYGFAADRALAAKLRNEIARLSVLKKRRNPTAKDRKAIQKLKNRCEVRNSAVSLPIAL